MPESERRQLFTPQQEADMRAAAAATVRARRAQAAAASAYQAPEVSAPAPAPRRMPPTHQPTSTAPRRTVSSQHNPDSTPTPRPASRPAVRVPTSAIQVEQPHHAPTSSAVQAPERKGRTIEARSRRINGVGGFAIVAVVGIGAFALMNPDTVRQVWPGGEGSGESPNQPANVETSIISEEFGPTTLPTVTGPDGLNLQNCKADGAAVASMMIDGEYALRYILQLPDGSVQPNAPYLTERNLEGSDIGEQFATHSGYPEMTVNNVALNVYACEKPNTVAVQSGNVIANNIDFIVEPAIPAKQNNLIQKNEAYPVSEMTDTTIMTWPYETFLGISDNPTTSDGEALPAEKVEQLKVAIANAVAAHAEPSQQGNTFHTAIKTMLASAQSVSATEFNQEIEFKNEGVHNLSDAIRIGLKHRLGEGYEIDGTIGNFVYTGGDAPKLINTAGAPEDSFQVTGGEVVVGQYTDPYGLAAQADTQKNEEEGN